MALQTPYYLIDEKKLLRNLKIIQRVRERSGAKSLLALKCFSTWCVFDLISKYLDGVTASSPYEARLGKEKFGKEVHVYSVGFSADDIRQARSLAHTIIFNSVSQLIKYQRAAGGCELGLRINPQVSYSHFDLADPARKYSRLGVVDTLSLKRIASMVSGVLFHFNCENGDFNNFAAHLDHISQTYGFMLRQVRWVSLGGGIHFTKEGYPVGKLCKKLAAFRDQFNVQVYLEPGESTVTQSTELVTRVLDIVRNQIDIAIVDASTEAHMLDLLIYRLNAKVPAATGGRYTYMIAGRSCLAGDVFGTYRFPSRLSIGKIIRFADAGGYTMVKKNWFNGLKMPSIAVKRLDGTVDLVRQFDYRDFVGSLS